MLLLYCLVWLPWWLLLGVATIDMVGSVVVGVCVVIVGMVVSVPPLRSLVF